MEGPASPGAAGSRRQARGRRGTGRRLLCPGLSRGARCTCDAQTRARSLEPCSAPSREPPSQLEVCSDSRRPATWATEAGGLSECTQERPRDDSAGSRHLWPGGEPSAAPDATRPGRHRPRERLLDAALSPHARPPCVPSACVPATFRGGHCLSPLQERTRRLREASPATGSGSQGQCQQGSVTLEPAFPSALGPVSDSGRGGHWAAAALPRRRGGPDSLEPSGSKARGRMVAPGTGRGHRRRGLAGRSCWEAEGPAEGSSPGEQAGRAEARRGARSQLGGLERGEWGPRRLSQIQEGQRQALPPPWGRGEPHYVPLLPETLGAASPSAGRFPDFTSRHPLLSPPPWPPLTTSPRAPPPHTPRVCQPMSLRWLRPLSEAVSPSIKRGYRCTLPRSEKDEDKGTSRHQNVTWQVCQIRAATAHLHNKPAGSRQLKSTQVASLGPGAIALPSPPQFVCWLVAGRRAAAIVARAHLRAGR